MDKLDLKVNSIYRASVNVSEMLKWSVDNLGNMTTNL